MLVGVAVLLAVVLAWVLVRPPSGLPQAQVGKTAPDFSFTDLSGNNHQLAAYEGHPIVLWWVATYCSTCGQGTQYFATNYAAQYGSAGITLLEVESYNDLGQPGPSLSSFASQNGYVASPLWVLGAGSSGGTTTYNPDSYMDAYYVINSGGTVIDTGTNLPASFPAALQEAQGT
ncbi:MAG: redoxin domain-containing protein [Euryarchaeota archaeon]|nr:redoxin domain-containing protein [Euryarchaeota archaeon]MDE1835631.1 redoxin domain-containing protein [Euryarchaeota archaeon]MDE1878979.1 redoxin domain-containing protein [Euryarchaeota archaeon]MDE2043747.1 redoxin domain-containing protein [Thermoplasmata archaeon]